MSRVKHCKVLLVCDTVGSKCALPESEFCDLIAVIDNLSLLSYSNPGLYMG